MVYPTPQQVERSHSVFDPLHCVFLFISLRKFWHLPKPSSGTRVLFALHFFTSNLPVFPQTLYFGSERRDRKQNSSRRNDVKQ